MKRLFTTLLAVVLIAAAANAKDYKHSLGVVTGFQYGVSYKVKALPHLAVMADLSYGFVVSNITATDFSAKGMLAYQGDITQGQGIDLDWYAGGGVSFGMIQDGLGGKFGINAVGGIEANMVNAPIAFAVDFRPGYGLGFDDGSFIGTVHYFDYAIAFSIRYTF